MWGTHDFEKAEQEDMDDISSEADEAVEQSAIDAGVDATAMADEDSVADRLCGNFQSPLCSVDRFNSFINSKSPRALLRTMSTLIEAWLASTDVTELQERKCEALCQHLRDFPKRALLELGQIELLVLDDVWAKVKSFIRICLRRISSVSVLKRVFRDADEHRNRALKEAVYVRVGEVSERTLHSIEHAEHLIHRAKSCTS